jgi:hypothetical protein
METKKKYVVLDDNANMEDNVKFLSTMDKLEVKLDILSSAKK